MIFYYGQGEMLLNRDSDSESDLLTTEIDSEVGEDVSSAGEPCSDSEMDLEDCTYHRGVIFCNDNIIHSFQDYLGYRLVFEPGSSITTQDTSETLTFPLGGDGWFESDGTLCFTKINDDVSE